MIDDRDAKVDEVLADLDRALAVEPSPAVAARARVRMQSTRGSWFDRRWPLATAAAVALVVTGYLVWPRPAGLPSSPVSIAAGRPTLPALDPAAPIASEPRAGTVTKATRGRVLRPKPAGEATTTHSDPEVLVPPTQRIALEQLAAALKDGRLTTEALAAAQQPVVPEPLIVAPAMIAPFKADTLPPIGGGQ